MFEIDSTLPVFEKKADIESALLNHPVIIVAGETGSGKSTQLPKICLNLFKDDPRWIGHTQPRRLAARSLADRIATETKTALGALVGYKIRFNDALQKTTRLKLMTDGILLSEIEKDPLLLKYKAIILDEAHERSLNIDFLLGYLRRLLPKRSDLKLIITSATLDHERFSEHFSNAPLIEVSGRTYPVELRYHSLWDEATQSQSDLNAGVWECLQSIFAQDRGLGGDVLVFLPTERDIRECQRFLEKRFPSNEVLPLFSRLSMAEQQKVFSSRGVRKLILSTNVAETSVTVPRVHYVIDSGLARLKRYSHRSKLERLPIEPISQASANQRKGRCGRVAPGICYRLYSEDDFKCRKPFTDPEILRTNLAGVILKMAVMRLGSMEDFPFLTPPDSRYIKDGYRLLHELGAMSEDGQTLLPLGKTLAKFSVDPRLAKMLVTGNQKKVLAELLVITSFLSIADVRERPMEHQKAADEMHRSFHFGGSDFLTVLNLYAQLFLRRSSQGERRSFCKSHFLSFLRVREWEDLHQQLKEQVEKAGFTFVPLETKTLEELLPNPTFQSRIHQSVLSGLLSHVGRWEENKRYEGIRGLKWEIFPSAVAYPNPPKWALCYELIETHKAFGRMVAKLDPLWLEELAPHLIKKTYSDPFYEVSSGRVCVWMKLSLYGLDIIARRSVNYGKLNPKHAREVFIQEALVNEQWETDFPFMAHNQSIEEEALAFEHKTRQQDPLSADKIRFAFYSKHLPESVMDVISFQRWWRESQRHHPEEIQALYMKASDWELNASETEGFPDEFQSSGMRFPLQYHFSPFEENDGVTVSIPSVLFAEVQKQAFEWLVPGLLLEKVTELLWTLPKSKRRMFIPIAGSAQTCVNALKEVSHESSLLESLAETLSRLSGVKLSVEDFDLTALPKHLFMRVEIRDEANEVLAAYRSELEPEPRITVPKGNLMNLEKKGIEQFGAVAWSFGEIADSYDLTIHGVGVRFYPSLIDQGSKVDFVLESDPHQAKKQFITGLYRLIFLALESERSQVRLKAKHLDEWEKSCRVALKMNDAQAREDLALAAVHKLFASIETDDHLPKTPQAFQSLLLRRVDYLNEYDELARQGTFFIQTFQEIQKRLKPLSKNLALWEAFSDLQTQLNHLIYPNFLADLPAKYCRRMPVYLKGIQIRLDRLLHSPLKDKEGRLEFEKQKQNKSRWEQEELRLQAFSTGLATLK